MRALCAAQSHGIARFVISCRIMLERMQIMLLEVSGRAQAEIRVLFKVKIIAMLWDTVYSTQVTRHAWPLRKLRFQPSVSLRQHISASIGPQYSNI